MSPEVFQLVSLVADLASVIAVVSAIFVLVLEKRSDRVEREYATYDALDDKYADYLRLCIEHPELQLYPMEAKTKKKLSAQQKIQQFAMFEILISLLERAFIMYRGHSSKIKKQQWEGWRRYINEWVADATFRSLWKELGDEYDENFCKYIDGLIAAAKK